MGAETVGFRLKSDQAIAAEVRRIVLQQLDRATAELNAIGDPESDEAIHDARRRVKKIRAVIRLVKPVLAKSRRPVDAELKNVSKLLAPVADGQGVIDTLNELAVRYHKTLPRQTVAALRHDLLERERRIDARAASERVLERAIRTLKAHRPVIEGWQLKVDGFEAIENGLKDSVRRARDAMIATLIDPSPERHHAWRHHVKNHWFHVRLLEGRCDNRLIGYQRRLEALDGVLGEYHNLVMLREVLVADTRLPGKEAARCLRVVSRYQHTLRRHAQVLGARVYGEKPRRFVRRVKRLWRPTSATEEKRKPKST